MSKFAGTVVTLCLAAAALGCGGDGNKESKVYEKTELKPPPVDAMKQMTDNMKKSTGK